MKTASIQNQIENILNEVAIEADIAGKDIQNDIDVIAEAAMAEGVTVAQLKVLLQQAKDLARDQMLEAIALRKMGVTTLKAQGRDSLDFHEVSVLSIQEALKAAYEAGRNS